jgi:hypothetical protein
MYKTQLKTTSLGATGLEITRVGSAGPARWIRSSPRRPLS